MAVKYIELSDNMAPDAAFALKNLRNGVLLVEFVCSNLSLEIKDKVKLIKEASLLTRAMLLLNILSEFFQYSEAIRKLIYTTNTVEGYHRQIRKVTKNKGVFPNDTALTKLVYLAYRNVRKKWTMPIPNWGIISQQLAIKFGDRYSLL